MSKHQQTQKSQLSRRQRLMELHFQLKRGKLKKVHLIPFSFSDGMQDITNNMAQWTQALEKAGYKVTTDTHCIGDLNEIIDIYRQHCKHAEEFRTLTAKERQLIKR